MKATADHFESDSSPVDNPSFPIDELPPTDNATPPASLPSGKQKALLPIKNPDKKKRKIFSIPLKEIADKDCVHDTDHDNKLQNYLQSMDDGKLEPMDIKELGVLLTKKN